MNKYFGLLVVLVTYIFTIGLGLPLPKENGPLIFHNCTTPGQFAITFGIGAYENLKPILGILMLPLSLLDDGPHPTITPELLSLLDRLNVPATFFVIGFLGVEPNEV